MKLLRTLVQIPWHQWDTRICLSIWTGRRTIGGGGGGFPPWYLTPCIFSEINKMKTWAKHVGNSYLEAKTLDKVYIIGGT